MIKLNEDVKNLACATHDIIKSTYKPNEFKVCCLEGILYSIDFECENCEDFGCINYRIYREIITYE